MTGSAGARAGSGAAAGAVANLAVAAPMLLPLTFSVIFAAGSACVCMIPLSTAAYSRLHGEWLDLADLCCPSLVL